MCADCLGSQLRPLVTVPVHASRCGPEANSFEAAPRDLSHRGGVAIHRHGRISRGYASSRTVVETKGLRIYARVQSVCEGHSIAQERCGGVWAISSGSKPSLRTSRPSVDGPNPAIYRRSKSRIFRRRPRLGEFYFVASSVRKSVCTFVRQLRGPHLSTWAWCSRRSKSAVMEAVSPSSLPQSSTGRFDVRSVDARS